MRAPKTTWVTPFFDAWTAAGGGRLAVPKHAKPLSRLIAQHGEEAVLARWKRMLQLTPVQFASAAKLEEAWGAYAPVEAARKAVDPVEAFYGFALKLGLWSARDRDHMATRLESARRRGTEYSWNDDEVLDFMVRVDRRDIDRAGSSKWGIERLAKHAPVPAVITFRGSEHAVTDGTVAPGDRAGRDVDEGGGAP